MPEHTDDFGLLTPREREVLQLVARGKTARQIAPLLGTTTSTVQHHLNHIRTKLGAKNNAHLVTLAFRKGLITPEESSS
jgi:two-component system, NarL family, invasion response regulator UvrY